MSNTTRAEIGADGMTGRERELRLRVTQCAVRLIVTTDFGLERSHEEIRRAAVACGLRTDGTNHGITSQQMQALSTDLIWDPDVTPQACALIVASAELGWGSGDPIDSSLDWLDKMHRRMFGTKENDRG